MECLISGIPRFCLSNLELVQFIQHTIFNFGVQLHLYILLLPFFLLIDSSTVLFSFSFHSFECWNLTFRYIYTYIYSALNIDMHKKLKKPVFLNLIVDRILSKVCILCINKWVFINKIQSIVMIEIKRELECFFVFWKSFITVFDLNLTRNIDLIFVLKGAYKNTNICIANEFCTLKGHLRLEV